MSDIISVIAGLENLVSLKGVSIDAIKTSEEALGLSFAADYAEYLKKYGLISAKHLELTGIVASKRLNVLDVTLSARARHIPLDMYVIEDTGIEGILILQNSGGNVFEFQNNRIKKICDSLAGYIQKRR
jgi:hypothetical protein